MNLHATERTHGQTWEATGRLHTSVRVHACTQRIGLPGRYTSASRVRPNPSFKPTRYGRQRKPGLRRLVHHLSPGLRCLPPRSA
jgi:hypothetical protein